MSFYEYGNKKIAFVHDHKFIKCGEDIYTSGTLTQSVFKRYEIIGQDITVCARYKEETEVYPENRLEQIKFELYPVKHGGIAGNNNEKLKRVLDNADVAIIRLPSFLGFKAAKHCRKIKKPYMIEVVGCAWDAFWNHSAAGKILAPYVFLRMKAAVRKAKFVTYVSEKFLQSRYPTKGKQLACSDVLLAKLDNDIPEKRSKKNKSRDNTFVLGTAAAVDVRYKGQQYVIKAMSELKKEGYNFKYRLAGGGDNTYLKNVAKRYEVVSEIEFCGQLPRDRVFEFMDNIDIYIQPSNQEGLPRAVVEAMSRACPVIGSNTGGIPELIPSECVFKRSSVRDLKGILKRAVDNGCREWMGNNFKRATDFEREKLDKKRNDFYRLFVQSIGEDNR